MSRSKRDVDFEKECGNGGCGSKVGYAKECGNKSGGRTITFGTEADDMTNTPGDVDLGGNAGEIDTEQESAKPKKKIKEGTDTDFTDDTIDMDPPKEKDDDECEDGECGDKECDEDDEECKASKKKKAKQDTDLEEDDEEDEEKSKKKSKKKKSKSVGDVDIDDEDFDDDDEDDDEEEEIDDDIDFDEEGFFGNLFKKKDVNAGVTSNKNDIKGVDDIAKKRSSSQSLMQQAQQETDPTKKAALIRQARMAMESSSFTNIPSSLKEHSDASFIEYMIDSISEDQLRIERQIMASMMEDLYKEYLMKDYVDDIFNESVVEEEYSEDTEEEDEFVQERFFGGTGKTASNMVKPVAKGARKLLDVKHGVGRKGIIRNVVHRTKKDLNKGGVLYKLTTWPFLVIKNLIQTLYHKTKSFIMYKGLLIGIEVKINREIAKIRKNARNLPKMALASGIGYATAALSAKAKGEPLPLKPAEFIAAEGAKLVEELGKDTMLRALTSRLADAIEESPDKIRAVIAENKEKLPKVTPEMGQNAKAVLSMNQNKITMDGVINMRGVNQMLNDIDSWEQITEGVVFGVRDGNEACVSQYLNEIKQMESTYLDDGKLNLGLIFNSKAGAVKVADFYEELASKLTDKTKKLEKGLDKITGLENAVKEGNISVTSETEKNLAELNNSIQHTCNAFLEMIDSVDDLGKYVMNTMNTYLGCLEQTASSLTGHGGGGKAPSPNNESDDDESVEAKPKKHKHRLFGKHDLEEE